MRIGETGTVSGKDKGSVLFNTTSVMMSRRGDEGRASWRR